MRGSPTDWWPTWALWVGVGVRAWMQAVVRGSTHRLVPCWNHVGVGVGVRAWVWGRGGEKTHPQTVGLFEPVLPRAHVHHDREGDAIGHYGTDPHRVERLPGFLQPTVPHVRLWSRRGVAGMSGGSPGDLCVAPVQGWPVAGRPVKALWVSAHRVERFPSLLKPPVPHVGLCGVGVSGWRGGRLSGRQACGPRLASVCDAPRG